MSSTNPTTNSNHANPWSYRAELRSDRGDFVDYDVEAIDGGIGKVVDESNDVDAGFLVVDTGFWIFGTKRLIPDGVVISVDHDAETIIIDMTKAQVKDAPEYLPHDPAVDERRDHIRPYFDYYAAWPWL